MDQRVQRDAPRTLLFVPADRAGTYLAKAVRSGADAIVVDLEDAVPAESKDAAREQFLDAARTIEFAVPVLVRTQAVTSNGFEQDVAAAVASRAIGLVLPKVSTGGEVLSAVEVWQSFGGRTPLPWIIPLLETPQGIIGAVEIASSAPAIVGLGLGGEDLRASLRAPRSPNGVELAHARGWIVLAASAAGKWVFDSVSLDVHDRDAVAEDARMARSFGFTGKFIIHPDQIGPVHSAMDPTALEVKYAERVVGAYEAAKAQGRGVTQLDGKLIDAPVVETAIMTLARSGRDAGSDD